MRLPFEEDELPTMLGIGCFFGTIALLFLWQAADGTVVKCTPEGCDIAQHRFFDKKTEHIAAADLRDAFVREYRDEDRAAVYKLELTTTSGLFALEPTTCESEARHQAARLKAFIASPTTPVKAHIGGRRWAFHGAIALFVLGFLNILIFNARRRMKAAAVRRHRVGTGT
jgi:hypothetical protein